MRVGAVFDVIDGKIQFLGYGTLLEESRPPKSITGLSNPKIELDNGKIVWGYECWWGPIGQIKSYLKCGKSIEIVDIDVVRKKQKYNNKQPTNLKSYFSEKNVREVDQSKNSVILIGPIRTGKTTIAKQLSKDTGLSFESLDDHKNKYYLEAGYDLDLVHQLKEEGNYFKIWKYEMGFYPYAIKRILEDYGTNRIIDFGGRHSVYQEPELLNQVLKMLESYANIVLILPSCDFHESLRILDERRGMRHLLYGFDANSLMLRHKSNYELAKHIHFNKKKTVKESSKEILKCLALT